MRKEAIATMTWSGIFFRELLWPDGAKTQLSPHVRDGRRRQVRTAGGHLDPAPCDPPVQRGTDLRFRKHFTTRSQAGSKLRSRPPAVKKEFVEHRLLALRMRPDVAARSGVIARRAVAVHRRGFSIQNTPHRPVNISIGDCDEQCRPSTKQTTGRLLGETEFLSANLAHV